MSVDKPLQWFRLYAEIIDDEKLGLLAFEDRWHYVAILCLKAKGVLDAGDGSDLLWRKVAYKLGLTLSELEKVIDRLARMNLIDRQSIQPIAWDSRQPMSDRDPTNNERQARFRERKKAEKARNGLVTGLDLDIDLDKDTHPAQAGAGACIREAQAGVCGDFSENPKTAEHPPNSQAEVPARRDFPDPDDAAVCMAMSRAGIGDAAAGDPKVRALLNKGVTVAVFENAAQAALKKNRTDFAYVLGIVKRMVQEAAAIGSSPGIPAESWDKDRRTIEAEGVRLGLGKWDEADVSPGREMFSGYIERVRKARSVAEAISP